VTENGAMRVRLLGGFEIEGVPERDLGSRKGRALLRVLAVGRGKPVSVDRIADTLWGDAQPSRPAAQVGVLVSRLRGVLGAERIVLTDAGYLLTADWWDVDELSDLATTASDALADGRVGAARAAAGAALALARGPLLPDEDGEWIEPDRIAVGATLSRVERLAVDAAIAAGDHGAAAALAEQALARDPYDEVVLRALIRSHLAARRPASALAAYGQARRRLAEDLGVSPTAETEALYAEALAAADGDLPPDASTPRPAPAGLVGRAVELAELNAALAAVTVSGVALVLVEGEAGMGKTSLVRAWSDSIGHEAIVLQGRCDELGRDLPLQPVADALADHLRDIGGERAAALVGDDAAALAPLLGPVIGVTATMVADAQAARDRVFAALAAAVSRAGAGGPVVVVIEDLHMAGGSTLAWLAFARRRCQRTLLVVTARPGGAKDIEPTHRIMVRPLARDAVAELVGADRAGALYERSGGHPLLLAALAGADDDELPVTLRDAVASRVESLGEHVAATLRVAAVLGPECDLELLAQVVSAPVVDLLAHLEAATQAGLLVEQGNGFAFRHQLFREALEAATGAARRALVHQVAARALAGRPNPDLLAVAIHARAGGDRALASSSFVAAALAAAARFDVDAAELHLASALDLAPTADALVARARLRMSQVSYDAAAEDAQRAIALGGGAAALEVAGWVAYYRRRYDEARAYADEAVVRATDDALVVSALALAGRVRHGAGDLSRAVEHLAAVHSGPPAVRGVAEVWLAQARVHQGRPADALAALARPMVDPDALAHPWAPLHLRFTRILALGQLGRVSDALRVSDDLDVAVGRSGAVGARFAGLAANARGWILRWSGRVEEADDRNWEAVEGAGGDAGPSAEAMAEGYYVALLDLADGCLLRGDADGAAALAGRLQPVDAWSGTMAWHQRHRLGLLRARLALAGGDPAAAAARALDVADDAAERGATRYELLAHAVVGLADRSVPEERLSSVVDGLGRCAVMDGWPLVIALATARRSERWRLEAERWAATIVLAAGGHHEPARRFVERVLRP
jgi:DNA-binding SARP family transcriptional activator/tetratricopeptide (TPR) repeat protein